MSETYQPKRRAIDPSIATPPTEDVANVPTPEPETQAETQAPATAMPTPPPNFAVPEGAGLQITGRVPAAFQKILAEKGGATQERDKTARPVSNTKLSANDPEGGSRLAEIIQNIQTKTTLYEEVILPSKGRFYDGEDGPTDGVIHIRPMTGEEEQILATPRFVKKGQAINMIFNRCMQEKFNSEAFITPDRTYLLIYLRGISYTQDYEVEVKCPHCDRKFSTNIDLNGLYVESCPDDYSVSNLSDTLPTTELKFNYRLSTGMDEQRIQEYRDRKLRGGFDTSGQADDTLIYRTSLMIEDIEGITDKNELVALLKKLPINDVAYLRNVVNQPPFGVETTVEIPCPGCLADFEIELPLEANFFFPRAKRKTTHA
jgi:hypothetical protein